MKSARDELENSTMTYTADLAPTPASQRDSSKGTQFMPS